jgi:hypothetical protein
VVDQELEKEMRERKRERERDGVVDHEVEKVILEREIWLWVMRLRK